MDPEVVNSKLHLIDLAGSERVEKTGSLGNLQKEASHINRSLTFLEQVVIALTQSKRDHIPYRQSKLTYLLKDSLGGNCHTFMIACIWPHINHAWETLSTLRFAARMKNIENQPVRNNLIAKEPVSFKLVLQVEQLKRELMMRDVICGNEAWLPELNKSQRERTIRATCTLASSINPTTSSSSLPHTSMDETSESEELSKKHLQERSSLITQLNMTHEDHSLDSIDTNVKSLSHVRLITGTMRALLWEACGQNQKKVEEICNQVMKNYNIETENSILRQQGKLFHGSERNGTGTDSGTGVDMDSGTFDGMGERKEENTTTDEINGMEYGHTTYNNENNTTSNSPSFDPISTSASLPVPVPSMTFDEYVLTPKGLPLFTEYEKMKSELNQNKISQRNITSILNNLKSLIDDLQDRRQQQQQQEQQQEQQEQQQHLDENEVDDSNSGRIEERVVKNIIREKQNEIKNDKRNDKRNENDVIDSMNKDANNEDNHQSKNTENKIIENNNNDSVATESLMINQDIKIETASHSLQLQLQLQSTANGANKEKRIETEIQEIGVDLSIQLAATKKEYRMASKELELSRFQMKEIQGLKKTALAILLSSFESHTAS